jgi:putative membrane protein insertion efficiency factor
MSAQASRTLSRMQRLLIGSVRAYRFFLSPWLGSACRFEPTCSVYALGSLQTHGAGAGSYLIARRLLRCHPWCEGGHDPVPDASPRNPLLNTKNPP